MTLPSSQTTLTAVAMLALAGLGALMIFQTVPAPNALVVGTIVGALAAVLNIPASKKAAPPPAPAPPPAQGNQA